MEPKNLIQVGRFIYFFLLGFLSCSKSTNDSFINNEPVYICNGPYSKSYHFDKDCKGLRSCTTKISETTILTAEKKGRNLCGYE